MPTRPPTPRTVKASTRRRWTATLAAALFVTAMGVEECPVEDPAATAASLDRTATIYRPIDWRVELPVLPPGNPFDLDARAAFRHDETGETIETRFFHDGGRAWVLRFTGTLPGTWSASTSSEIPELDGLTATVTVEDSAEEPGFITHFANRWGRTGTGEVYVPNFVMWWGPGDLAADPARIGEAFEVFFEGHGFNGLHVNVLNEWFQLGSKRTYEHESRDPDPRTFRILEEVIQRVYDEGGTVHLWYSGDRENAGYLRWGPGSPEEARLLRYIAARLGPLPGWTMGYGFDLNEDHTPAQINRWHDALQAELGWPHMLGARTEKDRLEDGLHRTNGRPMCSSCDYESWVDHRPDYDLYVELLDRDLRKPAFLEDRFRIRAENDIFRIKNYSQEDTRRGLWNGTMAGGAAAIWGNLIDPPGENASAPYPNPAQLATYGRFFEDRFVRGLVRCPDRSDGRCLKSFFSNQWIFYREDASSIRMDLSGATGSLHAVAVDAARPYAEIDLGTLSATDQAFEAPYPSDWAVAVGDFSRTPARRRTPDTPREPAPAPDPDDGPIQIFIPSPLNR